MRKWSRLLALALVAMMLGAALATAEDDPGELVEDGHEHFAWCNARDVCAICKGAYTGENIKHFGGEAPGTPRDEDTCWNRCATCGDNISYSEHARWCDLKSDFCAKCGAPYDGDKVLHDAVDPDYETTETQHGMICNGCGIILSWSDHVFTKDPDVCDVCGWPTTDEDEDEDGDEDEPDESPTATATPTPTPTATPSPSPTPEVTDTPTPTPEVTETPAVEPSATPIGPETGEPEFDEDLGRLIIRDEQGQVVYHTGFDLYQGARFYFQNGVQRKDVSGLVQIDDVWYAFDQGRVMEDEMLVPYDGGVFAFKDGTLDFSQNGLVTFNGEQFVFAAGMFQSDVFGAWLDPLSGDWVYVWYGQFYPITDLVSYDGEIFYFIDGKLALDFTGVVADFNGAEFNIVNGQAI